MCSMPTAFRPYHPNQELLLPPGLRDWFRFHVRPGVARRGMNEMGLVSNVPADGTFADLIAAPKIQSGRVPEAGIRPWQERHRADRGSGQG